MNLYYKPRNENDSMTGKSINTPRILYGKSRSLAQQGYILSQSVLFNQLLRHKQSTGEVKAKVFLVIRLVVESARDVLCGGYLGHIEINEEVGKI
jgi:hypothetical protein